MAGEALLEWVAGHPHDEVVPVPQGYAIAKAAVNVLGTADLIPIDAVKAHQFEMFECTI